MSRKPDILQLVEKQTHKSYGVRKAGCRNIILPPVDTPIFENTARCWNCGKTRHVNAFGFCEECWESLGKVYDLYMERHVNTKGVDNKFLKIIGFFGKERKRLMQVLKDARNEQH